MVRKRGQDAKRLSQLLGTSYECTTATPRKTSLRNEFSHYLIYFDYSNALNSFNVKQLSGNIISIHGDQGQKERENFTALCPCSPQNFGHFTPLPCRGRQTILILTFFQTGLRAIVLFIKLFFFSSTRYRRRHVFN